VTLSNDTVESNSASSAGGGIYIASLATVYIDPFTLAHVINNTAAIDPNIDGTYIET
jgi:predicted outer membrane repeat protein